MRLHTRKWVLSAVACVPLLMTTAISASADGPESADDIAAVVNEAAPGGGVAGPDDIQAMAIVFEAEVEGLPEEMQDVSVEVPLDAAGVITLETDIGTDLEVMLPQEVTVRDGELAEDGTVVYRDNGADVHAAVQVLDAGAVRMQTVLDSQRAPRHYTYAFGSGVVPVLLDDGSVDLTRPLDDGVAAIVATINAPWAIDAQGVPVDTWYSVEGAVLVQHVNPDSSAVYPIVADPKISVGVGFYAHWNRAETKTLASYGVGGMVAATTACAYIGSRIQNPWGALILGTGCAYVAVPLIHSAGVAENSNPKKCVYTRYINVGGIVISGTYRDSRCR